MGKGDKGRGMERVGEEREIGEKWREEETGESRRKR